jgi:hypothetical protein
MIAKAAPAPNLHDGKIGFMGWSPWRTAIEASAGEPDVVGDSLRREIDRTRTSGFHPTRIPHSLAHREVGKKPWIEEASCISTMTDETHPVKKRVGEQKEPSQREFDLTGTDQPISSV